MSNEENKTEETNEEKKESARGPRGELGVASAGLRIRQMWHEAYFIRENANAKYNDKKRIYVRQPGALSLKAFALNLLDDGDLVAEEWFANKKGARNQKRTDANAASAKAAGAATKTKRRADASKNQKK